MNGSGPANTGPVCLRKTPKSSKEPRPKQLVFYTASRIFVIVPQNFHCNKTGVSVQRVTKIVPKARLNTNIQHTILVGCT